MGKRRQTKSGHHAEYRWTASGCRQQNSVGAARKYAPQLLHEVRAVLRSECNSESTGVPHCECGGVIKPDVVLYEESLDQKVLKEAVSFISHADVLIVGGTSLVVYPAAGLIDYYRSDKLVLINRTPTARDSAADLVVTGSIGEIFDSL